MDTLNNSFYNNHNNSNQSKNSSNNNSSNNSSNDENGKVKWQFGLNELSSDLVLNNNNSIHNINNSHNNSINNNNNNINNNEALFWKIYKNKFIYEKIWENIKMFNNIYLISKNYYFGQRLLEVYPFKSYLSMISLSGEYSYSLESILPPFVRKLSLRNYSNKSGDTTIPDTITSLTLMDRITFSDGTPISIPASILELVLDGDFNQTIPVNFIPSSVQSLVLGNSFNSIINKQQLPERLESISFGESFNQDIDFSISLPSNNIKCIKFGNSFRSLITGKIPSKLESIHLSWSYLKQHLNSSSFLLNNSNLDIIVEGEIIKSTKLNIFSYFDSIALPNSIPTTTRKLIIVNDIQNGIPKDFIPESVKELVVMGSIYPKFVIDSIPNSVESLLIFNKDNLKINFIRGSTNKLGLVSSNLNYYNLCIQMPLPNNHEELLINKIINEKNYRNNNICNNNIGNNNINNNINNNSYKSQINEKIIKSQNNNNINNSNNIKSQNNNNNNNFCNNNNNNKNNIIYNYFKMFYNFLKCFNRLRKCLGSAVFSNDIDGEDDCFFNFIFRRSRSNSNNNNNNNNNNTTNSVSNNINNNNNNGNNNTSTTPPLSPNSNLNRRINKFGISILNLSKDCIALPYSLKSLKWADYSLHFFKRLNNLDYLYSSLISGSASTFCSLFTSLPSSLKLIKLFIQLYPSSSLFFKDFSRF